MDRRAQTAFGVLIVAQAAHSIEEYVFRLFDILAPARFISGLFNRDLAAGFLIANAGIVLVGFLCYLIPVRAGHPSARAIVWCWSLIELANGAGHVALAVTRGGYFPGLATAPLLIGVSLYLLTRLRA